MSEGCPACTANPRPNAQLHANFKTLRAENVLNLDKYSWFTQIRPATLPYVYPVFPEKLIKTSARIKFQPMQESRQISEDGHALKPPQLERCQFTNRENKVLTYFLKASLISLYFSPHELM